MTSGGTTLLVYPTFADIEADASLTVGQYCDVAMGALGHSERVLVVAAGTYASPDGVLVRDGIDCQLVSDRTEYISFAELVADVRTMAALGWSTSTLLTIPSIAAAYSPASDTGNLGQPNAGGQQLNVIPAAGQWPVKAFGALGDGATLDHLAFQAAISAVNAAGGGTVLVHPGVYVMGQVDFHKDDGTLYGTTSFKLLDGVTLKGAGAGTILRVKDGLYGSGAFYRMISSRYGIGLSNAGISDITLDGNSSSQVASTQCNNILIYGLKNIRIENVSSVNANGTAIQIVGLASAPTQGVIVTNCNVDSATNIGIQCSQFNGLVIADNYTNGSANNCIDMYGDAGSGNTSNGQNYSVTGNTTNGGLVGVFSETCADGVIVGNEINGPSQIGIASNRVNSQPFDVLIADNNINFPIGVGQVGIQVTGDTGGVTVRGNLLSNFSSAGVNLGSGAGSVSYVNVEGNSFIPQTSATPILSFGGSTASFINFIRNTILRSGYTLGSWLSAGTAARTKVYMEPPIVWTVAFGTVIQTTSKMTPVTCNSVSGVITTAADALASGASVAFVLNNSLIGLDDMVLVQCAQSGKYTVTASISDSSGDVGLATIRLTNASGNSLSEAVKINFRWFPAPAA